jgi:hypothetical protein
VIDLFTTAASVYRFIDYHQLREYILSAMEAYQTKVVNFSEVGLQTDKGKLVFIRRNSHNEQPLTKGLADYANQKTVFLSLKDWKEWKTSLVIDHAK